MLTDQKLPLTRQEQGAAGGAAGDQGVQSAVDQGKALTDQPDRSLVSASSTEKLREIPTAQPFAKRITQRICLGLKGH